MILRVHSVTEDDFIRRRRLQYNDTTTQVLLQTIWKIRSDYEDSLQSLKAELNKVDTDTNGFIVNVAVLISQHTKPEFEKFLAESATINRVYGAYLMKLQNLLSRVLNHFYAICSKKLIMIASFLRQCEGMELEGWAKEEACSDYTIKLYYVLKMCVLLRDCVVDSINTAEEALKWTTMNLLETTRFYYHLGIDFPNDLRCRNLMKDLLTQVENEDESVFAESKFIIKYLYQKEGALT